MKLLDIPQPKRQHNHKIENNHHFLAAFAELLVIVLERIRNNTEMYMKCTRVY